MILVVVAITNGTTAKFQDFGISSPRKPSQAISLLGKPCTMLVAMASLLQWRPVSDMLAMAPRELLLLQGGALIVTALAQVRAVTSRAASPYGQHAQNSEI